MNAMNDALKLGYSRDYKNMIRRYFNALSEAESIMLPDSTKTSEIEGIYP